MRVESARSDWKRRRKLDDEAMSDVEQDFYVQGHGLSEGSVQEERQTVASLTRQESIAHQEEWPSLDNAEKPVQFFRQFQTINSQRENLQHLRIRLREDRRSIKLARQKVLKATSEVLGLVQQLAERSNGRDAIIPDHVQNIAQPLSELEQMEITYDQLEGDLIPAEYRLKESEEELYERTIGTSRHGLIAPDSNKREPQRAAPFVPELDASAFAFQDEPGTFAPGYSLQLRAHRQLVEEGLARLDAEYAYLSAEAARRFQVGARLDEDDQFLIDSYIQSRGRLWNDLARIDSILAERALMQDSEHLLSGVGAEFDRIETLPILNELVEPEPGVYRWWDSVDQSGQDTPEILLKLEREDFEARENVFQRSLDSVARPQSTAEIFPGIIFRRQHTNSDSWFESVCGWLVQCAESSWASFDQFFGRRFDEENRINYKLLGDYLHSRRPTALFIPTHRASQALESLNSSMLTSEDKHVPSPKPDNIDQRSLHSVRFDRRNSWSAPDAWNPHTRVAYSRAASG